MAGDFNKPTVNSLYTAYPVEIRDMFADMAKWFDGTSTVNYPTNAIRWSSANSRWEKWNGASWVVLVSKYLIDVDTVDGYHAGNASGNIPISNGTVNTNLNSDMLDGYHAGNGSGNVPVSNGTVNTNLNADYLDGYHAGNGSGAIPLSNGTVNVNLNADLLDGLHSSSFGVLSNVNSWSQRNNFLSSSQTSYASAALESTSAAGNVLISWHASGASAAVLEHLRGGTGLRCLDASHSAAPLFASYFQQLSKREAKTEIRPIQSGALQRVRNWKLYDYEYIAQPGVPQAGVMADEADRRVTDGESVNLQTMIAELAAAVQELAEAR